MIPGAVTKCKNADLRSRAEALITNGASRPDINAAVRACMDFDKGVEDTDTKVVRRRKFQTFLHNPNAAATYDFF